MFTNKLLKKRNSIPTLNENNKKIFDTKEKGEIFKNHFFKTFQGTDTAPNQLHNHIINLVNSPNYNIPHKIKYINPREIKQIIKNPPNKKAPGHDNINTPILKNLANSTIAYINNIFNSILRTGHYPISWKHALIIPVAKPNKQLNIASNYRPISLLPTLAKILDKLILKRLKCHIHKTKTIPLHQFGFQDKLSTVHQLLRLTNNIQNTFQNKSHTLAVFLDNTQAFDRTWHLGILYKLKEIGTPTYLYNIIKTFLNNRTFAVKINNSITNPAQIKAGVPQGSPLSPTLYNIFISDLPTNACNQIAQFADDTVIFTTHNSLTIAHDNIQSHLHQINNWANTWKINFNPTKSIAKIFTLKHFTNPPPLKLSNSDIPWAPQNSPVKYLGLYLDTRLTWTEHVKRKIQQAINKIHQLKPLINRHKTLSLENSILLYKTIIRPILLYACPVWLTTSKTNINKIQITQNKYLRIITNAPWFLSNNQLHSELNLNLIENQIAKITHNFQTTLLTLTVTKHFNLDFDPTHTRIKNRFPTSKYFNILANIDS